VRRIEVLEICFRNVDGFCMSIQVGYYCIMYMWFVLLLYLKECLDEGFWMGGLIFL